MSAEHAHDDEEHGHDHGQVKYARTEPADALETLKGWTFGYHSNGDKCAGCGEATSVLFKDILEPGEIPYASFVDDLPIHPRPECLQALQARGIRRSPQALDKMRRTLIKDVTRPTPAMAWFFREDLVARSPFSLEDWANSVAESNKEKLDKHTARDIERLLSWLHQRLFH